MKYLLNISSRTVHRADSRDGRCKLKLLRDENKVLFHSYEDAVSFLPQGRKPTKPCAFCLGKDYEG